MYNSQYYTCEQVDQRLLQGYVDDYNDKYRTSLTKDQFLVLLHKFFNNEFIVQQGGTSTETVMSQKVVTEELNTLLTKLNILASGAETEITSSPSVVYRGEDQTFTLTGKMKKVTPTQMQLLDGATVIQQGTTSPITKAVTANISAGYKTYGVKGVYMDLEFQDSVDVQARYPIFYGFGSVPTDVAIAANRYAATLSAAHTYQRTSTQNGKNFFILVPSDISGLSTFVMNGAPFVMQPETATQITVNGVSVTYKVYKSAVAYNSGILIKVAAS